MSLFLPKLKYEMDEFIEHVRTILNILGFPELHQHRKHPDSGY